MERHLDIKRHDELVGEVLVLLPQFSESQCLDRHNRPGRAWSLGRCSCLWQGVDWVIFKVPSSPSRCDSVRMCAHL